MLMDAQSFLLLSFLMGYLIEPLFCIRIYPPTWLKQRYYKTPQWKRVRKKVLERDGHECQHTGETENLHVHHKTDVNFFNPKMKHLITLSASAHKKEHHRLKVVNLKRKRLICYILFYVALITTIILTVKA